MPVRRMNIDVANFRQFLPQNWLLCQVINVLYAIWKRSDRSSTRQYFFPKNSPNREEKLPQAKHSPPGAHGWRWGLRERKPHVYLALENAQNCVLSAHIGRVTKVQTFSYSLRYVTLTTDIHVHFFWRHFLSHDQFTRTAERSPVDLVVAHCYLGHFKKLRIIIIIKSLHYFIYTDYR